MTGEAMPPTGNPEEFLRFIVLKATGSPFLVKDQATLNALRNRDNSDLVDYFRRADLHGLASIFHQYRAIFQALQTTNSLKLYVNKIRWLSRDHPILAG